MLEKQIAATSIEAVSICVDLLKPFGLQPGNSLN
jgi:hypothetical protein